MSDEHVCDQGLCRADGLVEATPSALTYARGGRRLRALHYVAGGASQFRGLHDSQLDFDCEFAPDVSKAGYHCVPKVARDVIYLDPSCTEPAVTVDVGDPAPLLPGGWISALATGPATRCVGEPAGARASYRVGEQVFAGGLDSLGEPLPKVYAASGAQCAETPLQTALVPPSVHRLEPADSTLLVAGTLSTIDVVGGLSLQRVAAEDGTQVTLGILGFGGEPCSLQRDGRCVPQPVSDESGGYFLDAECNQPAFFAPALETCGRTALGVRADDAGAVRVFELVQTQSAFTPASDLAGCTALLVEAEVYQAGADVTDRFPQASVVQTGTGALQLTRFMAPSGASASELVELDPGAAFGDAQGNPCQVKGAIDGSLRCLPERSLITETDYWTDETCGERLSVAADPAVDPSELRFVRWRADTTQPEIEALFSLTPHTGPVYQIVQTECVNAGAAPMPLLARGEELPLSSLARVESAEL